MKASLSFLIIILILFCSIGWMETASSVAVPANIRPAQDSNVTRIERSGLSEKVVEYSRQHPRATAREITAYANSVMKAGGFDYEFEIKFFIERHRLEQMFGDDGLEMYDIQLEQMNGQRKTFRAEIAPGMCSESFLYLPAIEVTKSEFTAILNGQPQRFRRPKDFYLDTMQLVESAARKAKTIRRWEVPEQTAPEGISADGKTLYLPVIFDREDGEAKVNKASVLAVSASGLRFEVRADALKGQKAEDVFKFPKDPNNSYLGFRKFRVAGRSYLIRYSNPCC